MTHPTNKQQIKFGPRPGTKAGKSEIGAYPEVIGEETTLDMVIAGRGIARYGDGELNLAMGGTCISQRQRTDAMQKELLHILANPGRCLVGIPNTFSRTGRQASWLKYATVPVIKQCFPLSKYVSSFITRPDSAPWIDMPAYWDKMRSLWQGRTVTLVYGGPDSKSLKPDWLVKEGAARVIDIAGKRTNAYAGIDELQERVGKVKHPVLICLGPTATCLAWRLANQGVWAIDLGHVGMFMRSTGAFNYKLDDLASPGYRQVLMDTHAQAIKDEKPWGTSARKFVVDIVEFYRRLDACTMLDYGCGQRTLQTSMGKLDPPIRVMNFDPGIEGLNRLPLKPGELVVCTEVLEHVEFDKLNNVLGHINALAQKGAFLTIACAPANETLADGRNAHLVVENAEWWLQKVQGWNNWYVDKHRVDALNRRVFIWLVKKGVAQRVVEPKPVELTPLPVPEETEEAA